MKHVTIPVEIPFDMLVALNETEKGLKNRLQHAIAVLFFREGRLTLGKAIQLSGLTRYEFEKVLARNKVSVSELNFDQITSDVKKLEDL